MAQEGERGGEGVPRPYIVSRQKSTRQKSVSRTVV